MPKYEVGIKAESRPDGDPIEVPPLGLIENGSSVVGELPEEEYERLKNSEGSPVSIKTAAAKAEVTSTTQVAVLAAMAPPEGPAPEEAPVPEEGGGEG